MMIWSIHLTNYEVISWCNEGNIDYSMRGQGAFSVINKHVLSKSMNHMSLNYDQLFLIGFTGIVLLNERDK